MSTATSTTTSSTTPTTTPAPPPQIGEKYLNDVVDNWQVLRQRNILNAEHCEVVERQAVQFFKTNSQLLDDYQVLTTLLNDTIPTLTTTATALNESVNALFQGINELELLRAKLIESKNQYIIDQYKQQKMAQQQQLQQRHDTEYNDLVHEVNVTRNIALQGAIDNYKYMSQLDFENKVKQHQQEQDLIKKQAIAEEKAQREKKEREEKEALLKQQQAMLAKPLSPKVIVQDPASPKILGLDFNDLNATDDKAFDDLNNLG